MLSVAAHSSKVPVSFLFKTVVVAVTLLLFFVTDYNAFAYGLLTKNKRLNHDSTANILRRLKTFANCYDINWATWPSQNNVTTLTGSITDADGTPISVTMSANYTFGTTSSIYSYDRLAGYPATIPNATVPKTEWSAGTGGSTTMCFSRKVTNPVLLLASLGNSAGLSASLDFSTPYVVLHDGGGMVYNSSTKITGTEGYAVIMFPGDFTCVTINSTTPEYYTNLTWGIRPQPFNIDITDGVATCGSTTVTASGGISYQWSGGDTPTQATNTFHTNGTYTVTVTNASGCVTSASKAISVSALTAATVGLPVTLCNVNTYTLTGNSPAPGETGTWSISSTTGYNPFNASNIHNPNAVITGMPLNAAFDFTWTITKPPCDQISSASVLITNGISSKITNFTVAGQNGPAVIDQSNHTIALSVSPQTDPAHLTPTIFTDNGTLIPASGVERNFTSPVVYTLSNSCSSVNYKVTITHSIPEDLYTCQDAFNILLPATPVSNATYQWEKYINGAWQSVGDDGTGNNYIAPVSNTTSIVVIENYRRKTTVNGTVNYAPYFNVNINPQINNNVISSTANVICASGAKDVTITGSTASGGNGNITYQWQVSPDKANWQNIDNATDKNYQFEFNSTAKRYYQRLAISGGCRATSNSLTIDYIGYVTNAAVTISPVSCGQTEVILHGTPPNSNEIGTWTLTGPAGYNPFDNTNVHSPEVTLNNVPVDVDIKFSWRIVQTICGGFTQNSNSVHLYSNPVVTAGNDVMIENGDKTILNGQVSPNTTYLWSPANGLSDPTILNPVADPSETTVYTLTATNTAGCQALATVKVTVNNQLQIPNAITPNGDGINDTWIIKNLENHPNANVQVFTRSGMLVFSARGASKSWDATYNGKKLPAAVYYYVITLDDNKVKKSGWITVIY